MTHPSLNLNLPPSSELLEKLPTSNTEKKGKYRLMDKRLRLRQKSCACYAHFDKTRAWIEGETSISRPDFFVIFFRIRVGFWRDAVHSRWERYAVLYSSGVALWRQFTADWGKGIKLQKLRVNNHETQRSSEEKKDRIKMTVGWGLSSFTASVEMALLRCFSSPSPSVCYAKKKNLPLWRTNGCKAPWSSFLCSVFVKACR